VIEAAPKGGGARTYSPYDRPKTAHPPLLFTATDDGPDDIDARQFEAPTSMRDVEATAHIWVRFKQLDEK